MKSLLLPASLAVLGFASFGRVPAEQRRVDFVRDVRPILSESCFKCHGPDTAAVAAGLRLDSFAGATAHGAIVPGKPGDSRLIARVSQPNPALRMPPPNAGVKPLTAAQIETLRLWIAQGAKYAQHWSFVAPTMPSLPKVRQEDWVRNPVDRFVLARLEAARLKPNPEADRNTLAMRAAETLTGLPPDPDELAAFRRDRSPDAYERYVDRLLAKPAYGEHVARYWLDAVRYADTHGLQLDNERSVFPYRDWVVRAFNQNLPFDRFVQWQLAGDLFPNPTSQQLIATGFVRMNLTSNEGGAIPEEFLARNTFDRVDTASTVMLGLTVACAKCHDHKYDPIPTKDYYSLYAYFNSTQDDPLDGNIALPPPFAPAPTPAQETRLKALDARRQQLLASVDAVGAADWFERNVPPVPTSRDWQVSPVYRAGSFDEAFDLARPGEPGQPAPDWKPLAFEPGKDAAGIVGADNAFVYVRGTVRLDSARRVALQVRSDDGVKIWLNGALIHSHKIGRGLPDSVDNVSADFRAGNNELAAKVVNGVSVDGLNIAFGDGAGAAAAAFRKAPADPAAQREIWRLYLDQGPESAAAREYRRTGREREALVAAIPMTLIARELPKPRPTFVLKRGQYDLKGDPVERRVPTALGSMPKGEPNDRLGLARWLTSPKNPLTARVYVNRVWQQHFGTGIVKTVEDFGSQGELPVDPALLDYLAVRFRESGWDVKALHRLIVTSAAFRQSSRVDPERLKRDPENRLISRGPRYRLDAEAVRDKALATSGLLVRRIGGRGFKPYQPEGLWEGSSDPASSTHFYVQDHGPDLYRRSLYMFLKRTSPPPVLATFDSPPRDTCVVRRSATNTPLQALTLLNETAFLEAARAMGARLLASPGNDADRIAKAFELAFARPPAPAETQRLQQALARYRKRFGADPEAARRLLAVGEWPQSQAAPPAEQAAWMLVCSTLMNTDEFLTQH